MYHKCPKGLSSIKKYGDVRNRNSRFSTRYDRSMNKDRIDAIIKVIKSKQIFEEVVPYQLKHLGHIKSAKCTKTLMLSEPYILDRDSKILSFKFQANFEIVNEHDEVINLDKIYQYKKELPEAPAFEKSLRIMGSQSVVNNVFIKIMKVEHSLNGNHTNITCDIKFKYPIYYVCEQIVEL